MVNGEFDIVRFLVFFMMSAILTFLFLKVVLYLNKYSKNKQIDKLLLENMDLKIRIEKQATMIFRLESENKILKLSEENEEINKNVNL